MRALPKKRLQEGALSALRTPRVPPPPGKLVPARWSSSIASDEEIRDAIARAQAGDAGGFRTLHELYSTDVLNFVTSVVKDEGVGREVTEQVFAKLPASIGGYEDQGRIPFAAWIMRVARNEALDHLRAKRVISTGGVGVTGRDTGIDGKKLRQALEQLPEDQREVLILRHIAGLSPVEIAEALGRSESSIYGLQHRGRRALQAKLSEISTEWERSRS